MDRIRDLETRLAEVEAERDEARDFLISARNMAEDARYNDEQIHPDALLGIFTWTGHRAAARGEGDR